MSRKLKELFKKKPRGLFSVYFTAGYPTLESTAPICALLERHGVDFIEIGVPFSDPVADGPVIQQSSEQALRNGMGLVRLFEDLRQIRNSVSMPVVLMGYFNPVLQFGVENFCRACAQMEVDGAIIPDLPFDEYLKSYEPVFRKNNVSFIPLITPQTSDDRICAVDKAAESFIYVVSSPAVTGSALKIDEHRRAYLKRVKELNLSSPLMIGFGIKDRGDVLDVGSYANGVIVGSEFIRHLNESSDLEAAVSKFAAAFLINKS